VRKLLALRDSDPELERPSKSEDCAQRAHRKMRGRLVTFFLTERRRSAWVILVSFVRFVSLLNAAESDA